MTLQELGIDEATWTLALINAGLWKPGQRCELSIELRRNYQYYGNSWHHHCACYKISFMSDSDKFKEMEAKGLGMKQHDIPLPEPTDTLLMAMLRDGLKREPAFLIQIDYRLDGVDPLLNQATLDAAIIRATASLGVNK